MDVGGDRLRSESPELDGAARRLLSRPEKSAAGGEGSWDLAFATLPSEPAPDCCWPVRDRRFETASIGPPTVFWWLWLSRPGAPRSPLDWGATLFAPCARSVHGRRISRATTLRRYPRRLLRSPSVTTRSAILLAPSPPRLIAWSRREPSRRRAERLATLGRIATSLAHEVRNPAAAIRLHTDLLLVRAGEGELGESATGEESESLQMIRDEADRISSLVGQWLFVARPSPGRRVEVNPTKLIEETVTAQEAAAAHCSVRLEFDDGASAFDSRVSVDRERIDQVLRNVVRNAIQDRCPGQALRGWDDAGDRPRGSDPSPLPRTWVLAGGSPASIWGPFFSEREGGMGIGLTLSRRSSRLTGFDPGLEPGRAGAVVEIRLPVSVAREEEP